MIGSELEEKIWAVGTPSEVLGTDLTYNQAVGMVNRNLDKPGICIMTAKAAGEQEWLKKGGQQENGTSGIDEQLNSVSSNGHSETNGNL